ncbi:hypothetical protein FQR65_LT01829 [Abscondita terminalis]|nr:hypothetical protein FQR65_LT01829 [Abscondita terminalis]
MKTISAVVAVLCIVAVNAYEKDEQIENCISSTGAKAEDLVAFMKGEKEDCTGLDSCFKCIQEVKGIVQNGAVNLSSLDHLAKDDEIKNQLSECQKINAGESLLVLIILCFAFTSAQEEDECRNQYPVNSEDLESFWEGSLQNAKHLADYLYCLFKSFGIIKNDGTVDLEELRPYADQKNEIAKLNQCKEIKSVSCNDKDTVMKLTECVRDFSLMVEIQD